MGSEAGGLMLISALLVLGNAFFVAAEYSIVGARRSRVEAIARRQKTGAARSLLAALDNISPLVAACQIGITMLGIGVGSVAEPYVSHALAAWLHQAIDPRVAYALSFLIVAFVLVVVGELFPKYLVLAEPERVALILIRPLRACAAIFTPLVWLTQAATSLLLRPFKIDLKETQPDFAPRDELMLLIRASGAGGALDAETADRVAKALKFDELDARDVMVHRLDVKWLDVSWTKEETLRRIKRIPFTRLPVCRGDIDDLVGLVYLHDIVRRLDDPDFSLEKIVRPAVFVPENLTLDRIVAQMRDSKTQMLVVMDEYGGTSGVITLEDVVEEVFGELEDTLESERPAIESHSSGRLSAKADVRLDELLEFAGREPSGGESTETLATVVVNGLGRVPRPGDAVQTALGTFRVENMARRRITRVSVMLREESPVDEG